jgi:hypothetical protein
VLVRTVGVPVRRIKGMLTGSQWRITAVGSHGFAQKVFDRPTPKAFANLARRNTPGFRGAKNANLHRTVSNPERVEYEAWVLEPLQGSAIFVARVNPG